MDLSLEREGTVLGSLFQQIINDMKNTSPLWEDFVAKASKLHACLRAAIQAIGAYLDAFQKIADAATNSRGASKEIGTALTRVCLRHKAVETRLKTFTTAIMDCLVQPLQEKLEEWKRTVTTIDKEHAKEYKRCRTELKKRSTDTLRLQKKARKGQSDTLQTLMDSHMQDVTQRRAELEEVEKKSLRSVMVEERMRYCSFVNLLQPVVKEECEFMSELGHLQEAMQSIALVTKDPNILPQASEELIHDVKANITLYPESPGGGSGSAGACSNSLGSRKSSVCSISSMNSSGSSNSPGHHHYPRSLSQLIAPSIRLKPGESSDSGFCSTPALTTQASTTTAQTSSISTWPPHSQDGASLPPAGDRPHTISTTYEKGHQRPPLTVYTFENPEPIPEGHANTPHETTQSSTQKSPASVLNRPPLPVRCSSLERPLAAKPNGNLVQQKQCPSPIPAHITNEQKHYVQQQHLQQQQQQIQSPPTYVNMSDLANMTALKNTNQQRQQQQMQHQHSTDSVSSQISNDSINMQHTQSQSQQQQHQLNQTPNTLAQQRSLSISSSSASSSNIASLHSQASIDSAVATPLVGQTPTPSSGSSTPQNHYSPLLNNSDGTPSNASIASGALYTYSSTPPPGQSVVNSGEQALKTIEANRQKVKAEFNLGEGVPAAAADTDSPTIVENDERSRASVLQKASMFEKQAQACSPANATNARASHERSSHKDEERQHLTVDPNGEGGAGGGTRIARRASVNAAKPPPPVRRSSSVTPGQNSRTTSPHPVMVTPPTPPPIMQHQQQQQREFIKRSPLQQHNSNKLYTTTTPTINHTHTDSALPPPPAYLLEGQRQTPVSVLPNSTMKVVETVKNLAALRQQPASPIMLRRQPSPQQQQHQQQQQQQEQVILQHNPIHQPKNLYCATISTSSNTTNYPTGNVYLTREECDYTAYYNPYVEVMHNLATQTQENCENNAAAYYSYASTAGTLNANIKAPSLTNNEPTYYISMQSNTSYPLNSPSNPLNQPTNSQQQQHQHQQQQRQRQIAQDVEMQQNFLQQQQQQIENEANYGTYMPSFRNTTSNTGGNGSTGSGGIYAQPKLVNSMSSFRSASPSPSNASTPTNGHLHPQPKTNPNLIAQLNARLNSKQQQQQQQQNEQMYNATTEQPEPIYMRANYGQQQQQQQQHMHQQKQQSQQQQQHQSQYEATSKNKQQQQQQQLMRQQQQQQQQAIQQQQQQQQNCQFYSCPPPLENPPPPPATSHYYAASATATMPKKGSNREAAGGGGGGGQNLVLYAAAMNTMPRNYQQQQQRMQQQQQQQVYQQPQMVAQQPVNNQRGPMPLPHNQQQLQQQNMQRGMHKSGQASLLQQQLQQQHHRQQLQQQQQQQQHKQPPVPKRHSSVQQQKIYVATNPFVQTSSTNIHCHSSKQAGSPTCSSPSSSLSMMNIYGDARENHGVYYNNAIGNQSNVNVSSTNSSSLMYNTTGSIRAKTKAEFLENLNAKLAKQGMSGRAYAVRNLINSKALPDPRICHESLMDQIKRGATLKRNQKINDRSAPKIH